MDFTPIIVQVWGAFGWFIPLMLLVGLLKSPWAKGHIGELLVRLLAHRQLDRQACRRLHNVTLNTPDGTTQIDNVFLSAYGIFVLVPKKVGSLNHRGISDIVFCPRLLGEPPPITLPLRRGTQADAVGRLRQGNKFSLVKY